MAYCQQCAKLTGGPVIVLRPHRTTMALKGDCERCGYVWMSRDGDCCDAECKFHGSQAKADVEAEGPERECPPVESVSRLDARRSASATSEIMDATAGETAPIHPQN